MRVLDAVRLYLDSALWRATGLRRAGRALVHALGSRDEGIRALAGMSLVQAGRRELTNFVTAGALRAGRGGR